MLQPTIGPLNDDEKSLLVYLNLNGSMSIADVRSQMYNEKPYDISDFEYSIKLANRLIARKFSEDDEMINLVEIREDRSIIILEEGRKYAKL